MNDLLWTAMCVAVSYATGYTARWWFDRKRRVKIELDAWEAGACWAAEWVQCQYQSAIQNAAQEVKQKRIAAEAMKVVALWRLGNNTGGKN